MSRSCKRRPAYGFLLYFIMVSWILTEFTFYPIQIFHGLSFQSVKSNTAILNVIHFQLSFWLHDLFKMISTPGHNILCKLGLWHFIAPIRHLGHSALHCLRRMWLKWRFTIQLFQDSVFCKNINIGVKIVFPD